MIFKIRSSYFPFARCGVGHPVVELPPETGVQQQQPGDVPPRPARSRPVGVADQGARSACPSPGSRVHSTSNKY